MDVSSAVDAVAERRQMAMDGRRLGKTSRAIRHYVRRYLS